MKIEDFAAYQRGSRRTWGLIRTDRPIVYPTLGLANEAGETPGEALRRPGVFGPALEPPPGADEQTKLPAFTGRRSWG